MGRLLWLHSRTKRRFRSRVQPLRWRTFPGFRRKEKEVNRPRDVYSLHQGHFFGFGRGHQIRNGIGIIRGGIRSSLSHPPVSWRILSECHHIPRGWSDFYYSALCARRDSRPLDHQALLCGCTGWVRGIPPSCGWVLQLPERVGIRYLVCFACLFLAFCISCLHFPSLFSKKIKRVFPIYHYQAWTLLSPCL